MHGEGKLTYQSTYEYIGGFKNGSFYGEGILTRHDGFGHIIKKSAGRFENGEFIEGYLIEDINRGDWKGYKYEGNFEDGAINGNGIMISYASGRIYEGNFSDGYRDGKGVIKFYDGQYDGEWLGWFPYGRGTWTANNGSIKTGILDGWDNFEEITEE